MEVKNGVTVESMDSPRIAPEAVPSYFDPDKLVERGETAQKLPADDRYDPDKLIEVNGGSGEGEVGDSIDKIDVGVEVERIEASETHPPRRTYVDDRGEIYRVDDELIPDSKYEINGYTYQTDGLGRIASAEGTLRLKEEGRKKLNIKDSMEAIGKGSQKETDDRGHLIADRFEGGNGLENIVPMDGELNKGSFNKLENRLADAVKDGCTVQYKVEPKYADSTQRPSEFVVTDVIDGETTVTVFKNERSSDRER